MTMEEKRLRMQALRIGATNYNRQGQLMVVLEYNNNKDVVVGFDTGGTRRIEWKNFRLGTVIDWMHPIVCGVGFIGIGKFNTKNSRKAYNHWQSMLTRCYNEKEREKHPTYKGCEVCDEWHNFQNFAKWYNKNYYEVDEEIMNVDKDILVKHNKIYSPYTCVFAPTHINALFIRYENRRGDLPIGVSYNNGSNKYQVVFRKDSRLKIFGSTFKTPEEAFQVYKIEKERHIREIADRYKDKIPEKLYKAMYAYEVEITD